MNRFDRAVEPFMADLNRLDEYMDFHACQLYQVGLGSQLGGRVGHLSSFSQFKQRVVKDNFIRLRLRSGGVKTVPSGSEEFGYLLWHNKLQDYQRFTHFGFVDFGFGPVVKTND